MCDTPALKFTESNYLLYVTSPKRVFLCEKYYIMHIITVTVKMWAVSL